MRYDPKKLLEARRNQIRIWRLKRKKNERDRQNESTHDNL